MKPSRIITILVLFFATVSLSHTAYSAFKTGRIGGAKNLVATPVVDLITALNAKLGQVQLSQLLSTPGQWLANSDIEDLNLNLESFGGFPLDQHELAFLTHSLASAISDNTTTLGNSQAALQNLITSSITNSICSNSNCSETSADWVHGQISDSSFTDNVNMITASLLDDLMSGDSSHVDGYTSTILGANNAVSIQDLRDDAFFQSISNPTGNQPPPATELRNAINYIAGFVQPATVGAPTPTEYTAGQTLADNFLNNSDRGNFTLANFISCFNNNEASRSGGQGTCNVTASAWDQQLTALANFNSAKSTLAGGTALSLADLQAIPVTFGNLTAPIQEWHADYISSQLGTGPTVSLTDWQNTINSINEGVAARWKIEQVAINAAGHSANDVTNHLLARATDGTFDVATALGAGVSKTAAGFGGSTNINGLTSTSTPAQIQSAVLSYIGFTDASYTAWLANSDRANFTLADWNDCYASTRSFTGGANSCSTTSQLWSVDGISLDTLYTRASGSDSAPSIAEYTEVGIDMSSIPSDLSDWELLGLAEHFVQNVFPINRFELSSWQAAVSSYTRLQGSRYALDVIESEYFTGWSEDNITSSMINSAMGGTIDMTALFNMASGKSFTDFRDGSLFRLPVSDSSTWATSMGARMGAYVGLTNGSWTRFEENTDRSNFTTSTWNACYASSESFTGGVNSCTTTARLWGILPGALANGWSQTNYELALGITNSDWTNSSADSTQFVACLSSDHIATGGAGTCNTTLANWNLVGSSSTLAFTWDPAMPAVYTVASNNSAFRGCNVWRDKMSAIVNGGGGYTIRYSLQNVPATFSSLTVNSSTGIMSYDFNQQNNQAETNLVLVAEAVRDGAVWGQGTKTVRIKSIERNAVAANQELVLIRNGVYSGNSNTQNGELNNTSPCPSGYELTTNTTKRNAIRDLMMHEEFGSGGYSRPANYFIEECSHRMWRTNWKTNGQHWSHLAAIYGRNNAGNRTCLTYDNEGNNTNRSLAPYPGSCSNWDVDGNSYWFGPSRGCLHVGTDTKYIWND